MKCLISFILIILCGNLINSLPYNDEDYLETIQDVRFLFNEGSGQVTTGNELSSSTSSDDLTSSLATEDGGDEYKSSFSDDLVPLSTTTSAPEDFSNYTKEILQQKIEARFSDLRSEFINNLHEFMEETNNELELNEISISTYIDLLTNKYNKEIGQIDGNIKRLESKRADIQDSIMQLEESLSTEAENAEKFKKLNERKKVLEDLKVQGYNESHGFLDDNAIDDEIHNVDKQIAKNENKANSNDVRKELRDSKEIQVLNTKYLEVIHIYKMEIEEQKRKQNFELISKLIQDKLTSRAEFMENKLYEDLRIIKYNAETFLSLDKLKSNQNDINAKDDTGLCKAEPFEWRKFISDSDTKRNGVFAGKDLDGSEVYVIRREKLNEVLYGKIALRSARNDAYVTSDSSEKAVDDYEILISKNYKWCKSESYKLPDDMPPICRAKKDELFVPGTIIEGGVCRIGFGYGVIKYTEGFEVLSFYDCNAVCSTNFKIWF